MIVITLHDLNTISICSGVTINHNASRHPLKHPPSRSNVPPCCIIFFFGDNDGFRGRTRLLVPSHGPFTYKCNIHPCPRNTSQGLHSHRHFFLVHDNVSLFSRHFVILQKCRLETVFGSYLVPQSFYEKSSRIINYTRYNFLQFVFRMFCCEMNGFSVRASERYDNFVIATHIYYLTKFLENYYSDQKSLCTKKVPHLFGYNFGSYNFRLRET